MTQPLLCSLCGSDVTHDAAMQTTMKFQDAVTKSPYHQGGDWEWWAGRSEEESLHMGTVGLVTLIAKNVTFNEEQGDDGRRAYLVFRIGDHLIRKDGMVDSYGEVTWNGLLRPVKAGQKIVTTYEYE